MPHPEPCSHPYPRKLSFVVAEEVRRLHRAGASVKKLAERYGVAKASISAILKLHTYAPPQAIAVALPLEDRALLRELAKDDEVTDEILAADLLGNALDRRVARRDVSFEESRLIRVAERRGMRAGSKRKG